MAKLNPFQARAYRAELAICKADFQAAEAAAKSARTPAEKKKAVDDMARHAADITRLTLALK